MIPEKDEETLYYFRNSKVEWEGPGVYSFIKKREDWACYWTKLTTMTQVYESIKRKPGDHVVILHEYDLEKITDEN